MQSRKWWIQILVVCVLAFIVRGEAFADVAQGSIYKESFLHLQEDLKEAAAQEKILVVYFEQEGCSYCELVRKVNLADRRVAELVKKKFDIVLLNSLGSREVVDLTGETLPEKQYAYKLGIQFSPMLVFFDGAGKEIFRMKGYYKPDRFSAALQYLADGAYKTVSFKDYAENGQSAVDNRNGWVSEPFIAAPSKMDVLMRQAKKQGKGVALLFAQEQCPDCADLHQEIFSDPRLVKQLTDKYIVTRVHVLGRKTIADFSGKPRTEAQLADALGVRYTPTVIFFNHDGREILRYESYLKRQDFAGLLRFVTTDAWQHAVSFQDWLRDEYYAARKL